MSNFLPENYKIPSGSGQFMKLEPGDNKIRILSDHPVMGYEWWEETEEGRKPHRVKDYQEAIDNKPESIKHFWAFVVYNYNEQSIQVLEVTQKTIMNAIKSYVIDEDWGDPSDYDLVINRKGEGLDTIYQVIAKPKKKLPSDVKEAYEESDIKIEALFEGKYPVEDKSEEEEDSEEVADSIPF